TESSEVLRFGPRFTAPARRQAIELAVDRRKLSRALFEGRALVPRTYLAAPLWAASDIGDVPAVDVARARVVLVAGGYGRGTFGILEKGSDRFTVSILV